LIPESVLAEHGWTSDLEPAEQRALRGRIRIAEAEEEIKRLGYDRNAIRVLQRQSWFTAHQTPGEFLHPDLSLRDVGKFTRGPMRGEAAAEIREVTDGADIVAAPDPNDRLLMHRIVTGLLAQERGKARLLTYECLSTVEVTGKQILFGFVEELLEIKIHAIR